MRALYRLGYVLRDAWSGLSRHPGANLAAVVLVAAAVFVLACTVLVDDALRGVAVLLESQTEIRAFIRDGEDPDRVAAAIGQLPGIASLRVEPAAEALERFRATFPGAADLLEAFDRNPFPDALVVQPAGDPGPLARALERHPLVSDVIWAEAYLPQLEALAASLREAGALGLGAVFATAFLVTMMTVHLNVLHRRDEVDIRLLVGASATDVRMQFLVEAICLGLFGGLIGGLAGGRVVEQALAGLRGAVPAVAPLLAPVQPAGVIWLGAALGGLLAAAASLTATVRAVRQWRDFR
ncbi:MAG TPA: permease-like cell division protein FtsX [Bacillota bacterium]